jgi:hypothetical protein
VIAVLLSACGGASDEASSDPTTTVAPSSTTTTTTLPPPPVPRWAMFGDSTALSLALVSGSWELATGRTQGVGGVMELGCGIVRGGTRRYLEVETIPEVCDRWPTTWAAQLAEVHPDIALVTSCQWETVDRMFAGEATWRSPDDPAYRSRIRDDYLEAADLLASQGALVIWLTCAHFGDHADDADHAWARASHEQQRIDDLNAVIGEVAAERPDAVRVIDLGGWMEARVLDTAIRADGSHYDPGPGDDVITSVLGPALVATWQEWWPTHAGSATG